MLNKFKETQCCLSSQSNEIDYQKFQLDLSQHKENSVVQDQFHEFLTKLTNFKDGTALIQFKTKKRNHGLIMNLILNFKEINILYVIIILTRETLNLQQVKTYLN